MKNSCKITFEGLNINRLLSLLGKKNIAVYGAERVGKRCTIQVPSRRAKQTIALLQERCYNIIGIEFFGLPKAKRFVKKHFVLPIICLLTVLILVVSSQFCLRIEVVGDFDRRDVCSALDSVGVRVGSNLRKLNLNALQNGLANELDAMYAVIKRSGSVLYINAVAKKEAEPPIKMDVRRDIVATRSGTVTSILCEQGTPLVKAGDEVDIGDILIEGRRVYNDGTSEDVYALGRVVIGISCEGFAAFDGTKEVTVETGNIFKATGVMLFGKEYVRRCPFLQYTVSATVTRLFPLGLEIRNNVYRETITKRVSADINECIDELKAQAKAAASDKCDFDIADVEYRINDDGVVAVLYGILQLE